MKDIIMILAIKPIAIHTKTKDEFIRKVKGSRVLSSGCSGNLSWYGFVNFDHHNDLKGSTVRVYKCWRENKGWSGAYYDVPLYTNTISEVRQDGNTFILKMI